MMRNKARKIWQKISTSRQSYEYLPLDPRQVRILTLHPSKSFEGPLIITLRTCDLRTSTDSYEALSYVWGNPTRNISIECNGAVLEITPSLEIALRRLRLQNEYRVLWVDAICINQDDLEERAQQVPLMREIYPRAAKVDIWLGEADEDTELALETIRTWAIFNSQYRDNSDSTRYAKFEEQFAFKPGYRTMLKAVGALTCRSWFDRCWTFQEVILSTNAELQIGEFRLSWDCFYHALEAFPVHLLADDLLNFNALFMCHGKARTASAASKDLSISISRDLSRLLQLTRNFTASDPRDKIYSLLSVASLKNSALFQPRYDMSVSDTYITFTLAMIHDEGNLNVLLSSGEEGRNKDLPSWCPDWNCKRGVTLIGFYDYTSYSFNAGLRPDLSNLQMNAYRELELDGALIDVVKEVHDLGELADELKTSLEHLNFASVLSKFARKFGLHTDRLQDGLSPEATLLRTLSADHWFFGAHLRGSYKEHWFPTHLSFSELKQNRGEDLENEPVPRKVEIKQRILPYSLHQDSTNYSGLSSGNETCLNENKPEHLDYEVESPFTHSVIDMVYRKASPFYVEGQDFDDAKDVDPLTLKTIAKEAISQALFFFKGKHILITRRGFIAVGSAESRVGDNLCSFWGADVPFVIRENKDGIKKKPTDSACRIICECYIDGLMYGELFRVDNKEIPNKSQNLKIQPMVDWLEIKNFRVG
ncbi:BgTH12-03361 [Blumeria graminis f. sp. triticale]|nr:BgTH12-03361 [Blumeria graminis f. sp. triticale]